MKKNLYDLGYTGDEPDYILESYRRIDDWVQLRKGFRHKGLSRKRIYRISEDADSNYIGILDNENKLRKVSIHKLKYITNQQRDSAHARGLNSANNY